MTTSPPSAVGVSGGCTSPWLVDRFTSNPDVKEHLPRAEMEFLPCDAESAAQQRSRLPRSSRIARSNPPPKGGQHDSTRPPGKTGASSPRAVNAHNPAPHHVAGAGHLGLGRVTVGAISTGCVAGAGRGGRRIRDPLSSPNAGTARNLSAHRGPCCGTESA